MLEFYMVNNWKLEKKDFNITVWRNKKYYSVVAYMGKYKDVSKMAGITPKWSNKYYFEVNDPGRPRKFKQISKLFKNKTSALKFAKTYMKKH